MYQGGFYLNWWNLPEVPPCSSARALLQQHLESSIELLEADRVGEDYSDPDRVADMATDANLAYLDKAIWGNEEKP